MSDRQQRVELVSLNEACARLNVSEQTLRQWRRKGWIVATKLGRRVCFTEREIERLISRKTR